MLSFEESLTLVEKAIKELELPTSPAGLYDPIAYMLAMKGKKIRPSMTLLACNLWKTDVSAALRPALAWETFHNFTLMHDDLMDRADLRRGQATVHRKWGDNTAILSGDAMLILAYRIMEQSPINTMPAQLQLFSQTASEICEGQQYDMEFENRTDIEINDYLEMIRLKTAVLLGACLKSGAIAAEAPEEDCSLLYRFGIGLGLAFQIKDDLLDVFGNPAVFGKKIGGDILCDKKTFLLVNTLNKAKDDDRKKMLSYFGHSERPDEKIDFFKNLYNKLEINKLAKEAIAEYYNIALENLEKINVKKSNKQVLKQLSAYLIERES